MRSRVINSTNTTLARVESSMVHKRDPKNVLVGGARYDCGGYLALDYAQYLNMAAMRFADLMEVARQAGIYFMHSQRHVPEGMVFVLNSISLERRPVALSQSFNTGAAGGTIVVDEEILNGKASPKTQTTLTFHLYSKTGVATGNANVRILPRQVYERLRSPSHTVNRRRARKSWPENGMSHTSVIDVATDDPLLSDHADDHLPAMVVIVFIEKSVISRGADYIDSLEVIFDRYLEPNTPAACHLELNFDGSFSGAIVQDDTAQVTFCGCAQFSVSTDTDVIRP